MRDEQNVSEVVKQLNRAYLHVVRELLDAYGEEVCAKIFGIPRECLMYLRDLNPLEIDALAGMGGLLVKIDLDLADLTAIKLCSGVSHLNEFLINRKLEQRFDARR